ncbi:MAG: dihydroorotase, partial [Proteobacteria bacterium]|nr:dihydroorotase [Pseudomonadota bacterium]
MKKTLIKNAIIVNEYNSQPGDVLIKGQRIEKIAKQISAENSFEIIEAEGKTLLPGMIDSQVHFRDPGLTHKADF